MWVELDLKIWIFRKFRRISQCLEQIKFWYMQFLIDFEIWDEIVVEISIFVEKD